MLSQSRLYTLQSITVNSRIKQGLFLDVHGKKILSFLHRVRNEVHCYISTDLKVNKEYVVKLQMA